MSPTSAMSPITIHILDTATGTPAAGVPVLLEVSLPGDQWELLARGTTDPDGRVRDLLSQKTRLAKGIYRLTFQTATYFRANKIQGFYPMVQVIFEIINPREHHHIPLLLSPYGYSTYRGS